MLRTLFSLVAIIAIASAPVHAAGPTPEESLGKMKVADGFEVKLSPASPSSATP